MNFLFKNHIAVGIQNSNPKSKSRHQNDLGKFTLYYKAQYAQAFLIDSLSL